MSTPIGGPRDSVNSQTSSETTKDRKRVRSEPSLDMRIAQLKDNVAMLEYVRNTNPDTFSLSEVKTIGIGMADILENFNEIDRESSPENEQLFGKMDRILKDLGFASTSPKDDRKKNRVAKDEDASGTDETTSSFQSSELEEGGELEEDEVNAAPFQPQASIVEETKRTARALQQKAQNARFQDQEMDEHITDLKESEKELERLSKQMLAISYGSPENQTAVMNGLKKSLKHILVELKEFGEVISELLRDVHVTAKYANRLEKATEAILKQIYLVKNSLKIFDDLHSFIDEDINNSLETVKEDFEKVHRNADILEATRSPSSETPSTASTSPTSESKSYVEEDSDASPLSALLDAQADKDREMQKILTGLQNLMQRSNFVQEQTKHLFGSVDARIDVMNYLNRIIEVEKKIKGLESLYPDYETEYSANVNKIVDDLEPVLLSIRNLVQEFRKEGKDTSALEALLNSLLGPE